MGDDKEEDCDAISLKKKVFWLENFRIQVQNL
jgi:hypothetical protein